MKAAIRAGTGGGPAHRRHEWMGVFPATLCPFHADEALDEQGLRAYIAGLCGVDGIKGLVPNGHTGEIMSLREAERARVTRVVSDEVKKSGKCLKVISGVCGEGSLSAIDHALAAKKAGADGILLMPPTTGCASGGRAPRRSGSSPTWPRARILISSSTSTRPGPRPATP